MSAEGTENLPLDEALQLSMLGSPLGSDSGLSSAVRPTASGLVWVAVPQECVGVAYRVVDGGTVVEAISWSEQDEPQVAFRAGVEAPVVNIACSADGRLLATACSDGSLRCFSVTVNGFLSRWTLQQAHSHVTKDVSDPVHSSRAHGASPAGPIRSLQFHEYELLMVDAQQGKLCVYQADNQNPTNLVANEPQLFNIPVTCASWDHDTSQLFIGDGAGTVHVATLDLPSGQLEIIRTIVFPGDKGDGFACTQLDCTRAGCLAIGYCRVVASDEEEDDTDPDDLADHEPLFFVGPRTGPLVDLGDAVPFFSVPKHGRHVFFTTYIAPMFLVTCNVASDVAVVAMDASGNWNILDMQEGFAATTPTNEDDEYTYPTGFSSVLLPDGSEALLLATTDGSLSTFELLNQNDESAFVKPVSGLVGIRALPDIPVERVQAMAPPELVNEPPPVNTPPPPKGNTSSSGVDGNPSLTSFTTSGQPSVSPKGLFWSGASKGAEPSKSVFGQPSSFPAPIGSLFGSPTPSTSIFGQPSKLGVASPAVNDIAGVQTSESTTRAKSASVFGSAAPSFGSGSSIPSFGGGGFAALASSTHAGSPDSATSPFGAFGKPSGLGDASAFGSSTPSSMVKPLFETPKSEHIEETANTETPAAAKESPSATKITANLELSGRPGAERAGKAFESLDDGRTGSLPTTVFEALLEALGEGFHGDEYDAQLALIDPKGTGVVDRSLFVEWYVQLLSGGDEEDDEHELDPEELEEERQNAREAFESVASKVSDVTELTKIPASEFGAILVELGGTYGEEEHGSYAKNLSSSDGLIDIDAFASWYSMWVLRGDDDASEDGSNSLARGKTCDPEGACEEESNSNIGWGDAFASSKNDWKCDVCLSQNPDAAVVCKACEASRPGHDLAKPAQETSNDSSAAVGPSIGPGGFSFATTLSQAASAVTIGASGFSFNAADNPSSNFGFSFPLAKPEKTTHKGFDTVAFPPTAKSSPKPFVAATGGAAQSTKSSFPPMAAGAPKPFNAKASASSDDGKIKTAASPSASFPPMAKSSPKPFVAATGGAAQSTKSSFPPMAAGAPKPFNAKASASSDDGKIKTAASPSASFPPMAKSSPKPFVAATGGAAQSTKSSFPPMAAGAPKPFNAKASASSDDGKIKTAASPSASFPPMAKSSPKPFVAATGGAAQSTKSSFPPMAAGAPKPFNAKASASAKQEPPETSTFSKIPSGRSTTASLPGSSRGSTSLWPSAGSSSAYESQFRDLLSAFLESKAELEKSQISLQVADAVRLEKEIEYLIDQRDELTRSCLSSHGIVIKQNERLLFLLSRRTDIERQMNESKRLVDEQNTLKEKNESLLRDQPLDSESERLRRNLAVKALMAKRSLDNAESRVDLTRTIAEGSVEGKWAIFKLLKTDFDRTQAFERDSDQKLTKVSQLSRAIPSCSVPSPSQPAPRSSQKLGRGRRLLPLPIEVTSPSSIGNDGLEAVRQSSFAKWKALEVALKNADVEAPKLKKLTKLSRIGCSTRDRHFDMNMTGSKRGGSLLLSREEPAPHPGSSRLSFSSPVGNVRSGWEEVDSVDQRRLHDSSYQLPQIVKEVHATSAARDALSAFGTTPEKMDKTLRDKKKSEASLERMKMTVPALPSETTGVRGLLMSPKDQNPLREGSAAPASNTPVKAALPPLARKAPKPLLGSSEKNRPSDESKNSSTASTATASESDMVSCSSFMDMKGLGNSFVSSNAKDSSKPSLSIGADSKSSGSTAAASSSPDYHALLTDFYNKNNPSKVSDVSRHLQKYKGREASMFAKLAQKYKVPNPLNSDPPAANMATAEVNQSVTPCLAPASATPFGTSARQTSSSSTFSGFTKAPASSSPFGPPASISGQSPFGQQAITSTSSAFGASPSPFGNPQPSPSPFGNAPTKAPTLIGGRNTRDVLTEFYSKYNPTKVSEVDKLLVKYQGKEELLFINLAKKYNLDPSVFGITAPTPPPVGTAQATQQPGFGSPSTLGGGPSPFAASAPGGGFGQPSTFGTGSAPSAPAPGGFGSFGGPSAGGQASFGALAHSGGAAPAPSPIGASTAFGSTTGFGSPSQAFGGGSPFGAPRR